MSITELKKVSICGLIADKQKVLDLLQQLGCMHLIPASSKPILTDSSEALDPNHVHRALKYLFDVPIKRHQRSDEEGFDLKTVIDRALQNQRRVRETADRRDFLLRRIAEVEPWGDFELPPFGELDGLRFWFYRVPHFKLNRVSGDLVYQIVHRDHRTVFMVVISRDEPNARQIPVSRTHFGDGSFGTLRRLLEQCNLELDDLLTEREVLTQFIYLISSNLARAEDAAQLLRASGQTMDDEDIFVVQGWVPAAELHGISAIVAQHDLALLICDTEAEDHPPTLLQNPEPLAGGQEMLSFYQLPDYRSWDPSVMIFFSFTLFFAMILSDAGYALLLGAILLACFKRLGRNRIGRRVRTVGGAVVCVSFVYGILAGSFFGFSLDSAYGLARVHILDLTDFNAMMRLSVAIGCAHIAMAHLLTAFHLRRSLRSIASLAWVAIIAGGFIYWLGNSGTAFAETFNKVGAVLMAAGVVCILLFSSKRSLERVGDVGHILLDGLMALAGISKTFGDVLSYLRLFALGLASTYLAITFNHLSSQIRHAYPGLGLLLCILVLVIGHALNFILSIASGVVHGLRLNLIEFLGSSLPGDGLPFKPFEKKEKNLWTP